MNKKIKIKSKEKNYCIEIKYNFFRNKLINLIKNKNKIIIIIDRNVEYLVLNTNTESLDAYEINNQELLSYYNNNKDNYISESKRDFT